MNGPACICRIRWPRLYVVIEGVRYEVEPAEADTPTSALFRAWCAGCGAEYTYPVRIRRRAHPRRLTLTGERHMAESAPRYTAGVRPPQRGLTLATAAQHCCRWMTTE